MARFIYDVDNSDPKNGLYGIYDVKDQQTNYYTKEDIIKFQTDPFYVKQIGLVIDGLPKELQVVKKTENLQKAKKAKNDEFYTQLSDIEKELMNYDPALFKDKVIYCPTDVAYAQGRILPSEFVHYFQMNARRLGFKKLVATCLAEKVDNNDKIYNRYEFTRRLEPVCDPSSPAYNPSRLKYFTEDLPDRVTYYDEDGNVFWDTDDIKIDTVRDALKKQMEENRENYEYERIRMKRMNAQGMSLESKYIIDVKISECKPDPDGKYGSGDFRSKECTEILKKSDIVVTNPPFSLFREFIAWLKQDDDTLKPCIIVGPINSISYKGIFPMIQKEELNLGFSSLDKFRSPEGDMKSAIGIWYTTTEKKKNDPVLCLSKEDNEGRGVYYPTYLNYDGIDVAKVNNIPSNYKGNMGVPISFMFSYNPSQFKLVGFTNTKESCEDLGCEKLGSIIDEYVAQGGRKHVSRGSREPAYREKDGTIKFPYRRLVIKYTEEWVESHKSDFE